MASGVEDLACASYGQVAVVAPSLVVHIVEICKRCAKSLERSKVTLRRCAISLRK